MTLELSSRLLDLVVPRRCAVCRSGEELLCLVCRQALNVLREPLCARCGGPTSWPVDRCAECAARKLAFATARSAVAYEGSARVLVSAWKERGLRQLAAPLARIVAEVVPRPRVDVLTFVGGDPDRTAWRGQNPAEKLARALARLWELNVTPTLGRVETPHRQRGLSRPERRLNVQGGFRVYDLNRRKLALVDDVYTTGETAAAAASALRRHGASEVHIVTFARALRR